MAFEDGIEEVARLGYSFDNTTHIASIVVIGGSIEAAAFAGGQPAISAYPDGVGL